jgi:hypothetical protein
MLGEPALLCSASRLLHDAPWGDSTLDDEDAVLQAVLMASLSQEGCASDVAAVQVALLEGVSRPALVGPPGSLSTYAAEVSAAEPTRAALAALEAAPSSGGRALALLKIRGDGHCLFRAFAASLALGASWSGMLRVFQVHLDLATLSDCAAPAVAALRGLLGRNACDASLALEALNEEGEASRSEAAVAALRRCAAAYMSAHPARFGAVADDLDVYCERMRAMAPRVDGKDAAAAAGALAAFCPAYGGQPEMVALSEALRVRIEIISMGEAGGAGAVLTTHTIGDELGDASPRVSLLRRGLHFHLLLPAAAEGELLPPPA